MSRREKMNKPWDQGRQLLDGLDSALRNVRTVFKFEFRVSSTFDLSLFLYLYVASTFCGFSTNLRCGEFDDTFFLVESPFCDNSS